MTNTNACLRSVAALTATVLLCGTVAASAQVPGFGHPAVIAFEQATRDYALMHRRLERQLGPIEIGTPIDSINRIIQELAAGIRAERTDAQQGDLFTPDLARELRARINAALVEHDFTADDVRAAGRVEGIDYLRVRLRVNGTFPWVLGVGMFPCIIDVLPPLPPELQYRIVDNDLLLLDVHASLVVDILPAALTDTTYR